jgi:hypothetical protein
MTNDHFHFGYPEYIAPTDLSVANIVAHGGNIPLCDYQGEEFEVGQVVFFEFAWQGRAIPRKGRITKISPDKQKIKVLSNSEGGYSELQEYEPGVSTKMFGSKFWREFWIDMWACPIIIGTKDQKIYDC